MSSRSIVVTNDTQNLIDGYLLEQEKKRETRERSGKWSPSSFGRCYRYQFWNRKDEKPSNPLNVGTLRIFQAGKLFHDFVQSKMPEGYENEVLCETHNVKGYADIVLPDEVKDIKSIRSFGMKVLKKNKDKPEEILKDKRSYMLQVMTYAVILEKRLGSLVFIDKDSCETLELTMKTSEWKEDVLTEILTLEGHWVSDILPPAKPKAYGGKECNYCGFKAKCSAIEMPFIKEEVVDGNDRGGAGKGRKGVSGKSAQDVTRH